MTFVKSEDHFKLKIFSAATIEPVCEVVTIERIWNRADEAILDIYPEDKAGGFVDLDQVKRGDELEVRIDESVAFYGEVISKKEVRSDPGDKVRLVCHELTRRLAERQLDRVIYNGFRDGVEWETEADGLEVVNDIRFGIRPLQKVEVFNPQGSWNVKNATGNAGVGAGGVIREDGTFDRQVGILFQARSYTIEKIWAYIRDGETTTTPGPPDFDVLLEIQGVKDDGSAAGRLVPDGTAIVRRSGNPAAQFVAARLPKETWQGITVPATITTTGTNAISGADMQWDVDAVDGSGQISLFATAAAGTRFGMAKAIRLEHDPGVGTNITSVSTPEPGDPSIVLYPSPSGWVCFQFQISGSTSVEGKFEVFVDDAGTDRVAARILVENNLFKVVEGISGNETKTTFLDAAGINFTWSTATKYYLFLRLNITNQLYDVWWGDETPGTFVKVGQNFDFYDRATYTGNVNRISKWAVTVTDSAVAGEGIELGFMSGQEVGFRGVGRWPGAWTQVDFSADPVDVVPDQWYAIIARGIGTSTNDSFNWGVVTGTVGVHSGGTSAKYRTTTDGGTTWVDAFGTLGWEFPHMVEYSDSWEPKLENVDFVVDYDRKKINWTVGTVRTGVPLTSVLIGGGAALPGVDAMQGPGAFNLVRTGEYLNPSVDGIIEPANKMRVQDLVDHLIGFEPTIIGTAIDAVYDTATWDRDLFIIKQASTLEALRILARESNAIFTLTAQASPTFKWEVVTPITGFDPSAPADHQHVLSMDPNYFSDDDALRVVKSNVGIEENETFTAFPVFGAVPDFQVTKINHALEVTLGRRIERPPETFPKETDTERLWLFAEALNEVHGRQIVGGEIEVEGYWPLDPDEVGRLDINGIIRFINPSAPNGTDLSGTANVSKIQRLRYRGLENKTEVTLSNQPLHRSTEIELDELRNLLNGIQPANPNEDIRRTGLATGSVSATGNTKVYMALYVNDVEMDKLGYRRILCEQRVHDDGYISYLAYFPKDVGTISSDIFPVDKLVMFANDTQTMTVTVDSAATGLYRITIDGIHYEYTATVGPDTIEVIRDALFVEIDVPSGKNVTPPIYAAKSGTDTIIIAGMSSQPFIVSVTSPSSNMSKVDETPIQTTSPSGDFELDLSATVDLVYKWSSSTLHAIVYVDDSD